jgi:hypothetical protein
MAGTPLRRPQAMGRDRVQEGPPPQVGGERVDRNTRGSSREREGRRPMSWPTLQSSKNNGGDGRFYNLWVTPQNDLLIIIFSKRKLKLLRLILRTEAQYRKYICNYVISNKTLISWSKAGSDQRFPSKKLISTRPSGVEVHRLPSNNTFSILGKYSLQIRCRSFWNCCP